MGIKINFILILICNLILLTGCANTYNPVTAKNEFILINTSSEVALGGSDQGTVREITNAVFSLSQLGYSRQDETLADRIGVKYAYSAGFNPQGMISFFNKLKAESEKRGQGLPIEIFSSHPDLDHRIKVVSEEIKLLKSSKYGL